MAVLRQAEKAIQALIREGTRVGERHNARSRVHLGRALRLLGGGQPAMAQVELDKSQACLDRAVFESYKILGQRQALYKLQTLWSGKRWARVPAAKSTVRPSRGVPGGAVKDDSSNTGRAQTPPLLPPDQT